MTVKKCFCLHSMGFGGKNSHGTKHKYRIHHFLHKQKSKFFAIIQELTADQIKVLAHRTPFFNVFGRLIGIDFEVSDYRGNPSCTSLSPINGDLVTG